MFEGNVKCLTGLLLFYNEVFEAVYQDENCDIVYLDSGKAFDKVPHRQLLDKVKEQGANGKVLQWVRTLLSCRKQSINQRS